MKTYNVNFQVMGYYTMSNNIGIGTIKARSAEQAIELAREDLTKGMFKDVEISNVELFEDCEPKEDEDGGEKQCYNTYWSAKGKNGEYDACGGPFAHDEQEAKELQLKDLTMPSGIAI